MEGRGQAGKGPPGELETQWIGDSVEEVSAEEVSAVETAGEGLGHSRGNKGRQIPP